MTDDEMVGWHHQFNGYEFEQTPGDSEGQGIPVCCSSWGQQRIRWLHSNTNSVDMNLSKFWEIVEDRGAWHAAVHGVSELDMT